MLASLSLSLTLRIDSKSLNLRDEVKRAKKSLTVHLLQSKSANKKKVSIRLCTVW